MYLPPVSQSDFADLLVSLVYNLVLQVVVAGHQWSMMFDDGQRGVYKYENDNKVAVKRTRSLISSEDPALVDGLVDKVYEHARKSVLQPQSAVVNKPCLPSGRALMSLPGGTYDYNLNVHSSSDHIMDPRWPNKFFTAIPFFTTTLSQGL